MSLLFSFLFYFTLFLPFVCFFSLSEYKARNSIGKYTYEDERIKSLKSKIKRKKLEKTEHERNEIKARKKKKGS